MNDEEIVKFVNKNLKVNEKVKKDVSKKGSSEKKTIKIREDPRIRELEWGNF